ncbi:hypothetical protein RLIN73S_05837 [Rhodanobacter lindaniclasticus]
MPARRDPADTRAVDSWGAAFDGVADQRGTAPPENAAQWGGAQLYDAYCASCHQAGGEGSFDGGLPALFHNTATGRTQTNNLVLVILEGIHRRTGDPGVHMPGFAHELSDQQIATLGNYLTLHYGNPAAHHGEPGRQPARRRRAIAPGRAGAAGDGRGDSADPRHHRAVAPAPAAADVPRPGLIPCTVPPAR